MNIPAIQKAMSAIRDCALIMFGNAFYVQGELPNVELANPLRSQALEVCVAMVGTKHDVISELFEIDELVEAQAESELLSSRLDRCIKWLREDLSRLDQLIMALREDSTKSANHTLALILIQESATNVLTAFNLAKAAVDAATSDSNEKRYPFSQC